MKRTKNETCENFLMASKKIFKRIKKRIKLREMIGNPLSLKTWGAFSER